MYVSVVSENGMGGGRDFSIGLPNKNINTTAITVRHIKKVVSTKLSLITSKAVYAHF
jgi:hypothetical protein